MNSELRQCSCSQDKFGGQNFGESVIDYKGENHKPPTYPEPGCISQPMTPSLPMAVALSCPESHPVSSASFSQACLWLPLTGFSLQCLKKGVQCSKPFRNRIY